MTQDALNSPDTATVEARDAGPREERLRDAVSSSDDAATGEAGKGDPPEPSDSELTVLEAELAAERRRSLNHLRRALLAEHRGGIVPELVAGDSEEGLEASVAAARAAFESARTAALEALRLEHSPPATPPAVPAGTPPRDLSIDAVPLTPIQRIAAGLRG